MPASAANIGADASLAKRRRFLPITRWSLHCRFPASRFSRWPPVQFSDCGGEYFLTQANFQLQSERAVNARRNGWNVDQVQACIPIEGLEMVAGDRHDRQRDSAAA